MCNKIYGVKIWRLGKFNWACFTDQDSFIAIVEYYHLHILALFLLRLSRITVFKFYLSWRDLSFQPISCCLSSCETYWFNSHEFLICCNRMFRIDLVVSDRVGDIVNVRSETIRTFDCIITETGWIYARNVCVAISIWAIYIFAWGCKTLLKPLLKLRSCCRKKFVW
jgi:hypothetical protein